MTTRAIVWTLVVIAVLIIGGVWITHSVNNNSAGIPNTGVDDSSYASTTDGVQPVGTLTATTTMPVKDFVKQSINTLAPETPATGATYRTTNVTTDNNGNGTVTYTDGYTAYTADYTYTTDANGVPTITAFIPRSKG